MAAWLCLVSRGSCLQPRCPSPMVLLKLQGGCSERGPEAGVRGTHRLAFGSTGPRPTLGSLHTRTSWGSIVALIPLRKEETAQSPRGRGHSRARPWALRHCHACPCVVWSPTVFRRNPLARHVGPCRVPWSLSSLVRRTQVRAVGGSGHMACPSCPSPCPQSPMGNHGDSRDGGQCDRPSGPWA